MIFAKAKLTPRKKRPVYSQTPRNSIATPTKDDIKKLMSDPNLPLSYLLQDREPNQDTEYGKVQDGSMLPYHFQNYKQNVLPAEMSSCGETTFPQGTDTNLTLRDDFTYLNQLFVVNKEKAVQIEQDTVRQSASSKWFEERAKRLTSSDFAAVVKRKKDVTEAFLNRIFNSESNSFTTTPTSYGTCNEAVAKEVFCQENQDSHIHDCGLVVNPHFSFLAASPDGKVCTKGETGVLEVKCPYTARDLSIEEAVALPNFCLVQEGQTLKLNERHEYFYQIQGQMMASNTSFCIFVVYTRKGIFCQKIAADQVFQQHMLDSLAAFYHNHAVKYLGLDTCM